MEGRGHSAHSGVEVAYGFCNTWPKGFSKDANPDATRYLAQLLRGFFARAAHVAAGELVACVRLGSFVRPAALHWPNPNPNPILTLS